MFDTKLPRKIIGMSRNTGYSPEALDEFFHGYKGAWAEAARKEQSKWPETPTQDKHLIWPSQVVLFPSLAVVEDVYLNVNSKQETISLPELKRPDQNQNQIDHPNSESIDSKISPSITKNLAQLKVDTNEVPSVSIDSSQITSKDDRDKIGSLNAYDQLTINLDAFKKLCLSCAEDGERIARIHCYRPFFKKIDGLCDRIKQDLIHHDSVIPHVNAQGIVWAIKDFVFVCTRIINAWNITKGYVYDTSEGLNKVRSTLTSQFIASFVAWQETTLAFIASLMKSFLSLDILARTSNNSIKRLELLKKLDVFMENVVKQTKPRSNHTKSENQSWEQCGCDSCKIVVSSKATHNILMELSAICSEYGEKVALNYISRPFFKKIDSLCIRTRFELTQCDGALSNLNSQGIEWAIKELIFASTRIINAWNITKGYVYGSSNGLDKVRVGLSCDFVPSFIAWQETTQQFMENIRASFLRLDNLAHTENYDFQKENSVSKHIKALKDHLQQLKSAEVFFRTIFCRNYFPDFIAKTPDFTDVRSVIKKSQSGGYKHINEFVHDVRFIIYQVKKYLMRNINPDLDRAVSYFEADINTILAHKTFKFYNFDHIEGRPNEIIFLYN